MKLPGRRNLYLDGSSWSGGPLRFINQPLNRSSANVKWHRLAEEDVDPNNTLARVTIKTTIALEPNTELFLLYDTRKFKHHGY